MIQGKVRSHIKREMKRPVSLRQRIPNYTSYSILFRVLFNSLIAVLIVQFMVYAVKNSTPEALTKEAPEFIDYLRVILYFNLLSEIQIVVDVILEYFFPIPKKIKIRIALQIFLGLLLIVVFVQVMTNFNHEYAEILKTAYFLGIVLGLVFVTIVSTSLLMMRFTDAWILSQKQIDVMKQERLQMDYNLLQDKLNPHFLFNNLSVLKSLIIYDQDTAVKFTEDFTDVYRYVIESKDKVLIRLVDELEFIEAYIGLHKERLNDGLIVKTSIEKDSLNKEIAPLTLQLLVENAIKHNIASKDQPLTIEVITKDNYVGVINSLNKRETSYSTHTGLKNLVQRYSMLSEQKIEVIEGESEFMVKVPLV